MKKIMPITFVLLVSQVAFAGTASEKCRKVAGLVIAMTNARMQVQPKPTAGEYNKHSNPWEPLFYFSPDPGNVCCVSYDNAEPPIWPRCLSYTRDICVNIRSLQIESDSLEEGAWCGY